MNYTVTICFNDYNNAVINNNYVRTQDFIMVFKISMVKRNNFLGLCRKFGHAPSNIFASRDLVDIPTELFRLHTAIIGFQGRIPYEVVTCRVLRDLDFSRLC